MYTLAFILVTKFPPPLFSLLSMVLPLLCSAPSCTDTVILSCRGFLQPSTWFSLLRTTVHLHQRQAGDDRWLLSNHRHLFSSLTILGSVWNWQLRRTSASSSASPFWLCISIKHCCFSMYFFSKRFDVLFQQTRLSYIWLIDLFFNT